MARELVCGLGRAPALVLNASWEIQASNASARRLARDVVADEHSALPASGACRRLAIATGGPVNLVEWLLGAAAAGSLVDADEALRRAVGGFRYTLSAATGGGERDERARQVLLAIEASPTQAQRFWDRRELWAPNAPVHVAVRCASAAVLLLHIAWAQLRRDAYLLTVFRTEVAR
jgi:hypothetical protein